MHTEGERTDSLQTDRRAVSADRCVTYPCADPLFNPWSSSSSSRAQLDLRMDLVTAEPGGPVAVPGPSRQANQVQVQPNGAVCQL